MEQATNPAFSQYLHASDAAGDASAIDRILAAVRSHLGMEIAFASRIAGGMREFTHISADIPLPVAPGVAEPFEDTLCQRVLQGTLPELMHDARNYPEALEVGITLGLPVASHLNVPLRLSDGRLYGTFCCVSREPDHSLNARDLDTLRAFAELATHLIERDLAADEARDAVRSRIAAVLGGEGLSIVHQPIHELASGRAVGVECLARFPDAGQRGPDCWFAEAAANGLGVELELLAVRKALATLPYVPEDCYLGINVSPETVISGAVLAEVTGCRRDRLVIEVTEHEAVSDYAALRAALAPLRQHGRIAIDDVGAGYAGLRHIVDLEPDILKLDMSLTRDIAADPARRALAQAMVSFAREIGCSIVAEGVETEAERAALAALGVTLAQGYYFSRPMPVVAAQQMLLGRVEVGEAVRPERRSA
jgi:EAL domain-containing protein (putative c-di-GMP-specific phosphodiesterase class I)